MGSEDGFKDTEIRRIPGVGVFQISKIFLKK